MAGKEIDDLSFFTAVQLNSVLEDGKTFVDCIPKFSIEAIEDKYLQQKDQPEFDLTTFVTENFEMPPVFGESYESNKQISVEENILQLWDVLTRQPTNEQSSLINLPFTYVVPGGRFREIYYWDSYFTMLGLVQHSRVQLVKNMIDNFAFLIRSFGHIPNGNRRYYLSRSQPPFFALMVTLLADIKEDNNIFATYKNELEQEYDFWQKGAEDAQPGNGNLRVVRMPGGELLNRYFDNNSTPRQESYAEDVHVCKTSNQQQDKLFTNLRAGAESGWDFSSRWFEDEENIETIETTDIVPVDLNCLLYTLEIILAKANTIAGHQEAANHFDTQAKKRMEAIQKYCWNATTGFFCDYHLAKQHQQNNFTAAGLFPLFIKIAAPEQAKAVEQTTRKYLLKDGGIVTTTKHTGQQWDAPNGWAPLQWIAFVGLNNYKHHELANTIAKRWLALNEKVFKDTGKLMEKYNVEDLDKAAGGGEYPGQDGFGWTNGIYVALKNKLRD
ncbi:MAG: alpha,alpha-trehalase TreF [Ferruginibacter sp.]